MAVAKSLKSVAVDNRFVDLSKGGILPAGLVLHLKPNIKQLYQAWAWSRINGMWMPNNNGLRMTAFQG